MRGAAVLVLLLAAGCAAEQAEGRPWIHSVRIEGVRRVDKKDLKSRIQVEKTSWIPFAPKKYLDPFTLDLDRRRIEAYYAAHGFFAARVTEARATPRKDGKSVDIEFRVDEGEPTRIAAVHTAGLDALGRPGERLDRAVHKRLAPGDVFDHGRYLAQKERIERRLQTLGFAWAQVDGRVDVDRDARRAEITLTARPGPRATFGTVTVRGTEAIDPKLVAVHAQIPSGKTFDPQALEDARGRIYNLGVFSSVKVDYEHDAADPSRADAVITVREGHFRELRLGGGGNFEPSRYEVHLSGQYTRHNFFGGLRTLELRLEPGWVFLVPTAIGLPPGGPNNGPSLRGEATFRQPDFLWALTELRWTVGYDVGADYAYQYHGPRTTLGVTRPFWHERVVLGLSYNFNFLLFFNTVPAFQQDPRLAGQLYGYTNPYRVGWWQEDAVLDLRDRPLEPHQGGYLATTLEQGGTYAGGSFTYEKVQPQLRLYAPLGRRVTLAARALFGQIFVQGSQGSPVTRRFYLGGPDSHRGFNYNRLSLQVPSGFVGTPNLPVGGDQALLLQAELRVDLFRLFGNWLGITAFVDGGDVSAPTTAQSANLVAVLAQANSGTGVCFNGQPAKLETNVSLGNLHWAVGGGLRYRTVVGTVRADVGVRLNRLSPCEPDNTPNPDPGARVAFHVSIGEAF